MECGEQTDHSSLPEHLDEDCSKSSTTFDKQYGKKSEMCICEKCMKEVKSENTDFHLKEKCVMREVQCVFCDSFVPNNSLAKHYDICESALVRCGNKCGVKISRKDLSEHYRNECPKTLLACEHCEEKFERQLLEDHHEECVKFPIPCPESCGVEVAREDMERHLDEECQKLFAACAYKGMQCGYEGFPAGMTQHVKEDVALHVDLIKTIVENLQMKFESERKRNEDMKCTFDNLQLKLESEKKRNQEVKGIVENLEMELEGEKKRNQEVKGIVENLEMELEGEKKRNQEVKGIVENLEMELEGEKKRNQEVKGIVENLEMKLENERKRNEELQMQIKELRQASFLWR